MCTVTVIPLADGFRLACNRDEQRKRPIALLPVVRHYGPHAALLPIDPQSDGTWIAASSAGWATVVLNANLQPGGARPKPRHSRGELIPRLLHCDDPRAAAAVASAVTPTDFAPFRLILLDKQGLFEIRNDGQVLQSEWRALAARPHFFTSSGLGDHMVEAPRHALFNEFFASAADWPKQQAAFHRHSWPDRRHISICMARADARTVSYTCIELTPGHIALTYTPEAPDRGRPQPPLILQRAGVLSA